MSEDLIEIEQSLTPVEAAETLARLAGELQHGTIALEGTTYDLPEEVLFEVDLERETDDDGEAFELEFELTWRG